MRHYNSLLLATFAFVIIVAFSSCAFSGFNGSTISSEPSYIPPPTEDPARQKENTCYLAAPQNAPLLTEKNDLSATVLKIFDGDHRGTAVQAAFLPTRHLGLMAGYSTIGNDHSLVKYKYFEIGAGYVTSIGKLWHLETYAGFGSGKLANQYATGSSNIQHKSFFIQPAITFLNKKKKLQLGFTSKFTGNHFSASDTSFNHAREPITTDQLQLIAGKPFQLFWQPGIIFRFGWKNVLFHTSFSYAANLSTADLNFSKTDYSLGISIKLNAGKKKQS